ncbi:hypothetical protein CF319_g5950 [Tilletia indica]|nr:hypothetical protein CF319_g5950 [Tilletia indica]
MAAPNSTVEGVHQQLALIRDSIQSILDHEGSDGALLLATAISRLPPLSIATLSRELISAADSQIPASGKMSLVAKLRDNEAQIAASVDAGRGESDPTSILPLPDQHADGQQDATLLNTTTTPRDLSSAAGHSGQDSVLQQDPTSLHPTTTPRGRSPSADNTGQAADGQQASTLAKTPTPSEGLPQDPTNPPIVEEPSHASPSIPKTPIVSSQHPVPLTTSPSRRPSSSETEEAITGDPPRSSPPTPKSTPAANHNPVSSVSPAIHASSSPLKVSSSLSRLPASHATTTTRASAPPPDSQPSQPQQRARSEEYFSQQSYASLVPPSQRVGTNPAGTYHHPGASLIWEPRFTGIPPPPRQRAAPPSKVAPTAPPAPRATASTPAHSKGKSVAVATTRSPSATPRPASSTPKAISWRGSSTSPAKKKRRAAGKITIDDHIDEDDDDSELIENQQAGTGASDESDKEDECKNSDGSSIDSDTETATIGKLLKQQKLSDPGPSKEVSSSSKTLSKPSTRVRAASATTTASTSKRSSVKRKRVSPPQPIPAGGMAKEWRRAFRIVLQLCSIGPTDPARVADKAFLLLLPLQVLEEYRSAGRATDGQIDPWLAAVHTLERSHSLSMSRSLQLFVDACVFAQEYRTKWVTSVHSPNPADREEFQALVASYRADSMSFFTDSRDNSMENTDTKKMDYQHVALIGARILGLASILGSAAFIPFLLLTSPLGTLSRIRDMKPSTLAALSHLLRGGRPELDNLSPDNRAYAEAGIFGAHVVLPRILNHFLASAAKFYDARPQRSVVTALYIADEVDPANKTLTLPQPAVSRTDEDGANLPPIVLGMMSGYRTTRRPVTLPPTWLLTKNYSKFGPDSQSQKGGKTLKDLFPNEIRQVDKSYTFNPAQPNVDLQVDIDDALLLRDSYRSHFGIPTGDVGLDSLIASVERRRKLCGTAPQVPTHAYLLKRQIEFSESDPQPIPGGEKPFQATIRPIEDEEEDDDSDETDDEDDGYD